MTLTYVLMADGNIVEAYDICKKSEDLIYFSCEGTKYVFSAHVEEWCVKPAGVFHYQQTQFEFYSKQCGNWFATNKINSLLFIEEETNMNKLRTTQFNAGVLSAKIERTIAPMLQNTELSHASAQVSLPVIQVVPTIGSNEFSRKTCIQAIQDAAVGFFDDIYGKQFTLEFTRGDIDHQYVVFDYTIRRKEVVKEMTVNEIEKILGYKIKVVGDN